MKKNDIKAGLLKFKTKKDITKVIDIEDLGVELYIKQLSGSQRMRAADKAQEYYKIQGNEKKEDIENLRVSNESHFLFMCWFISATICDISGALIFEDEQEVADIIDGMPNGTLPKLFDQVQQVNGVKGEEDTKKPQETLEKTEN